MKLIILIFCCFILINCGGKNEKPKEEVGEYYNFANIKLTGINNNLLTFDFIYNTDYYSIKFFGKDIPIINIIKNHEINENIPSLLLDFENNEDKFIISELNKSMVKKTGEETIEEISLIKVSYKIFNINEIQEYDVSIIPTKDLINYLINLLDIYYLPIYVVQYGDTLSSICLKIYGNTEYEQIVKYNLGMKLSNQYLVVRPNQKIRIKL